MYRMEICSFIVVAVFLYINTTVTVSGAPISEEISPSRHGREKRETFDAVDVLKKFGYLQLPKSDNRGILLSESSFIEAIKSFQGFNGLPVTGKLDDETLEKMKSPRCGVPDKTPLEVPQTGDGPSSFTKTGSKWQKSTVTWKPTQLSAKLDQGEQWMAFQKAFDLWAKAIPVNFKYSRYEPDIEIKFASGDHGDGWQNRFNGRGGVLAHAYGPGNGIGGDTHFDEDEAWSMDTGRGTDLTTVAAHEFGHALGLGHSSVPGALMAPYYRYAGETKLHADDILGIQSLYGVRTTTTKEVPTSATTPTSTTTTTEEVPEQPEFCQDTFRLDAIAQAGNGYMYAFRLDEVYKIGPNGLEDGYPKYIIDVFPDAPRQHVRAVSYVPENNKIYIFKDLRVWRFSDISKHEDERINEAATPIDAPFQLDEGYPKLITTDSYYKPSAAITLTYKGISQVFLFSWDYFWEWDIRSESIVPGYPLPTAAYFPHAPGLPDAAFMNGKGNILFFKYDTYKFLQHRGVDGTSKMLGPDLFGAACGGTPTIFQHSDYSHKLHMDEVAYAPGMYNPPPAVEMELSPELWSLVILRQLEMVVPKFVPSDTLVDSTDEWGPKIRDINSDRNNGLGQSFKK